MSNLSRQRLKMQHNVYLEWSINGKAYFQAFRSLCRMRIEYAEWYIEQDDMYWDHSTKDCDAYKRIQFWNKVKEYWKKKLEESFTKEKEYFGE